MCTILAKWISAQRLQAGRVPFLFGCVLPFFARTVLFALASFWLLVLYVFHLFGGCSNSRLVCFLWVQEARARHLERWFGGRVALVPVAAQLIAEYLTPAEP
jgi:hypothetical protein